MLSRKQCCWCNNYPDKILRKKFPKFKKNVTGEIFAWMKFCSWNLYLKKMFRITYCLEENLLGDINPCCCNIFIGICCRWVIFISWGMGKNVVNELYTSDNVSDKYLLRENVSHDKIIVSARKGWGKTLTHEKCLLKKSNIAETIFCFRKCCRKFYETFSWR